MTSTTGQSTKQGWAIGGMIFAATLMLIIGTYQIFVGLAAIIQDSFFVVGANYAYEFDTTAWGWIHLIIGVLAVVAGFFLFTGATWAKVIAIALAVVSAIANFFFLPYYPIWSLLLIGLDIFVIWAIATAKVLRDTDIDDTAMAGRRSYAGEATQSGERWPSENVETGRHWAPEPAKEGAGQGGAGQGAPGQEQGAAEQQAAQSARGAGGMPPSGTPQPPSGTPPR